MCQEVYLFRVQHKSQTTVGYYCIDSDAVNNGSGAFHRCEGRRLERLMMCADVTTLNTMARLVMTSWRLMSLSRSRRHTAALTLLGFLLLGQLQCSSSDSINRSLAQSESARQSIINTERFNTTCRLDDLVDATLLPDFWNNARLIDARIKTNGDPPEQLVKVTDRRHRFPVFATVCSLAFLLTIIAIIVVCTH